MKQSSKVSIIMNCYNSEQFLKEAIDSVFAQTFTDWEIVFWDNVSTDKSSEIAKSYGPKLKYFKGEKNVPLGAARNLALRHAKGEYIAFLDCDDIWLPEKLSRQIEIFENDKTVSFIYSNFYIFDDKRKTEKLVTKTVQPSGNVFREFLKSNRAGLLTVMIRKSVLDSVDELFDEKLGFAEEYDLFMRILYKSSAKYIDEPLARYRIHDKMASYNKLSENMEEVIYVVEKLKGIEPDFTKKYSKEVEECIVNMEYLTAQNFMMKGFPEIARKYLSPNKFRSHKFFLYYLITLLPKRIYSVCWYMIEKVRLLKKNIV